jgi:multiple sugar transport system ATP-binding protein
MADLKLSGVTKSFGKIEVLRGIDLSVTDGEFVVFVGPSGCGKSTLLRIIAGLEDLTTGEILIGGDNVVDRPPAQRGIAMVFQTYALYPHKTVAGNMGYALKLARRPRAEIDAAVHRAAKVLELEPLLNRKPSELSGGQRQRVAIGRAIVRDPKVFLFDEPLSNLDAALRGQMRIEIADLHKRLGSTMVYVTHDQIEAMTMADRIVVMNAGRVEQQGSPLELYHNPVNLFVAGFLGAPSMNLLPATIVSQQPGGIEIDCKGIGRFVVPVSGAALPNDQATLGIRPHDLSLTDGGQTCSVRVSLVEPLGHETVAYGVLAGADRPLTAALSGSARLTPGEDAVFRFTPADCHLFDSAGQSFTRQTTAS